MQVIIPAVKIPFIERYCNAQLFKPYFTSFLKRPIFPGRLIR